VAYRPERIVCARLRHALLKSDAKCGLLPLPSLGVTPFANPRYVVAWEIPSMARELS